MTDIQTIIKAYIEGDAIEYRDKGTDKPWSQKHRNSDIVFYPTDFEYRIKPETNVRYAKVFKDGAYNTQFTAAVHEHAKEPYHNLKLTFENNLLTKAEVI